MSWIRTEACLEDSDGDDSNEDNEAKIDDGVNRTGKQLKWYRGENEFGVDWTG
jgi:hypothetical protein